MYKSSCFQVKLIYGLANRLGALAPGRQPARVVISVANLRRTLAIVPAVWKADASVARILPLDARSAALKTTAWIVRTAIINSYFQVDKKVHTSSFAYLLFILKCCHILKEALISLFKHLLINKVQFQSCSMKLIHFLESFDSKH